MLRIMPSYAQLCRLIFRRRARKMPKVMPAAYSAWPYKKGAALSAGAGPAASTGAWAGGGAGAAVATWVSDPPSTPSSRSSGDGGRGGGGYGGGMDEGDKLALHELEAGAYTRSHLRST